MKKFKGFVFIFLVIFILGGYLIYDLSDEKKQEKVKNENLQIFSLKQDQVQTIKFDKPGLMIALERTSSGWLLNSPVQDEADNAAVENFLQAFYAGNFSDSLVGSSVAVDLQKYAFDEKKQISIELTDNVGQSQKLVVSDLKNFENKRYAYKSTDTLIYLISDTLSQSLENNLQSFRLKKVFRGPLAQVEALRFQFEAEKFQLIRKDEWEVESKKKSEKKLDQNKVRELLTKISALEISNYLSEGRPSKVDLEKYGVGSVKGKVELVTNKKIYQFEFYGSAFKNSSDLFVISTEPAFFLLRLNPESQANLKQIKIQDLYKQHEAENDKN